MASFSSTSPPQPPMSSPPTTLALPAPTPKSNSKLKSPPVPWSHQETLALIQSYQDKWYSLKKGQLKAFQWEEVASSVPSKTSTQCRHKIEKLRKRYRSELPKPYPDSWQYFHLMDQMERGPNAVPMSVRPVSVFKSPAIGNGGSTSNPNPRYANVYSNNTSISPGYYNNNGASNNRVDDDGESDESDDEWSVDTSRRNKLKSINNIVRGGDGRSGVRSVNRGFGSENERFAGVLRNRVNGKGKKFYTGDDSDDDEDEYLEEEMETWADEEKGEEEGGEESGGGREIAARIRGFAESFMRMENHKVEMMRETERSRMEMENKRMDMILGAQRKIVDTIGRAFGANNKRPRTSQDS